MGDNTSISNESDQSFKIKEPGLYNVLLHNDDYTSMEFVVDILVSVFRKSNVEASKIMMSVHQKGIGIGGKFPYDIGMTKIQEVKRRADEDKFPLLCTLEKV